MFARIGRWYLHLLCMFNSCVRLCCLFKLYLRLLFAYRAGVASVAPYIGEKQPLASLQAGKWKNMDFPIALCLVIISPTISCSYLVFLYITVTVSCCCTRILSQGPVSRYGPVFLLFIVTVSCNDLVLLSQGKVPCFCYLLLLSHATISCYCL